MNAGHEGEVATTTLVMLAVGLFCSVQVPLGIFPVKAANGDIVKEKLVEIIRLVESADLEVLSIVCDNYAMNRAAYR